MTDHEKLVRVAESYRSLEQLRGKQALLMAEMIRACVHAIGIDVNTYRMRGHETFAEKKKQREKNVADKAQAPLYLLALATSLENSVRSPDADQPKGE